MRITSVENCGKNYLINDWWDVPTPNYEMTQSQKRKHIREYLTRYDKGLKVVIEKDLHIS
jgi:hypothetical protein